MKSKQVCSGSNLIILYNTLPVVVSGGVAAIASGGTASGGGIVVAVDCLGGDEFWVNDLLQLFQPFGVITKLVMLRAKNQALLQMQDVPSAINALQLYTNIQPTIRGRNVYVQFSSHQELTTMDQNTQGRGDEPNRILLVTIHHMLYPITVEVLHQVFSPHGFVEKIVTFQKSAGFQALIQYQSRQLAVQARTSLQGRNIYDGCCQLDIQFSKYVMDIH
ncbi:polypyrimidine tract-binding protein [Populus alba x Populus x berolinensis]|nr:polypyrimidine tract-binding protein [Populus alba x Populus x berolinensis]